LRLGLLAALVLAPACLTATAAGGAVPRQYPPPRPGLLAWGENGSGQLGVGTTSGPDLCGMDFCAGVPTPVQLTSQRELRSFAAGSGFGLAVVGDGDALAWGEDEAGQLGNGTMEGSDVPQAVCAPTATAPCQRPLGAVTQVSAGWEYGLALRRSRRVFAWGANALGELGDGQTTASDVPVRVPGLHGVRAISAGGQHALALLANGTVVAWGSNHDGELGDGETESEQPYSDVPVAVKGLAGVKQISGGGDLSMALLTNGTVEIWGHVTTSESEMLQNTHTDLPEAVSTLAGPPLAGVTAIAAGNDFSMALLENGTVETWGQNYYAQLGNGEVESGPTCGRQYWCRHYPYPIALSGVKAIAAGSVNGYALLKNGTVMSWGQAGVGMLGNGNYLPKLYYHSGAAEPNPIAVCGMGGASAIAAGGELALAYGIAGQGEPCSNKPLLLRVTPHKQSHEATTVTLWGDNLAGATSARLVGEFGGELTELKVISPIELTAVQPANVCGYAHVTTPERESPDLGTGVEGGPRGGDEVLCEF